ncbi:MAG: xanthine dehydrogenase family protein molybdopterin-binding subunit, partial [Deltaproteobacteria bacterium]|nr:xanthine dehydrogenase family protein molybdopterin-binding subunit [Deltaproteobacteria bacterium]
VAREMGIPLEDIEVLGVDTDVVPYDLTTSSSRSTFHVGRAVQLAAQDLMEQLKRVVTQEYAIPESQIKFSGGKVRLPEAVLDYREIMFKRFGMHGGTLVGQGQVKTKVVDERGAKSTSAFWFLGAGAAEVEVDAETGKLRLVKYVTSVDVGKAIHPLACRQQLEGAAIQGMGQALFEEIVFDNGQLVNPNFVDYVLPSLGDMPVSIEPILIEIPQAEGPFGAKGIGETALIPVAPAIANAIFDAVGVRIKDLPIKAEKIFLALEEAKQKP